MNKGADRRWNQMTALRFQTFGPLKNVVVSHQGGLPPNIPPHVYEEMSSILKMHSALWVPQYPDIKMSAVHELFR